MSRSALFRSCRGAPPAPDADAVQHWFWHDTAGGRAFLALHRQCLASADGSLQRLCNFSLVPRAVLLETVTT